jgi:hypothetical protein
MFIDRNHFEEWMRRIAEQLDQLEKKMDKPEKPVPTINGERLLDNTDLCFMLNCSKRTLQRFRVSGILPCRRINQKTYYLESEVSTFIREHLKKPKGEPGK